MRCRWVLVCAVCVSLLCSTGVAGAHPHSIAGGCGGTRLYRGTMPRWTATAMQDSKDPVWPFALSAHGDVTALVFGYSLRAGHRRVGSNKVLWIMRLSRHDQPLRITAHPLHASRPIVREALSANAGPGEIYPSYLNVPKAGCWRLTLNWAGHTDQIALRYS